MCRDSSNHNPATCAGILHNSKQIVNDTGDICEILDRGVCIQQAGASTMGADMVGPCIKVHGSQGATIGAVLDPGCQI